MQRVTIVRGIYSTQRYKSYPPKGNEQQTLLDHQFFLSVEVRTSLSQQDPDSWNCVVRQLKHEQTGYTRMLLTTGEQCDYAAGVWVCVAERSEYGKQGAAGTEKISRLHPFRARKPKESFDSGIIVTGSEHIPIEVKVRSLDRHMKGNPLTYAGTKKGGGRSQSKTSLW